MSLGVISAHDVIGGGGGGGGGYSAEVLADSPVGYWHLDETSGTSAADSSGNARNGTYVNAPTLAQTSLLPVGGGTAVAFDGANDHVTVAHNLAFNATSAGFTLEGWLQVDAPTADKLQVFADKTNTSLGSNHQWYTSWENRSVLGSPLALKMAIDLNGHATDIIQWAGPTARDAVAAGGHFVVTVTTSAVILYWNGVAVVTDTSFSGLSTTASTQPLRLGIGAGATSFPFDGTLDEVAIYDYALSPTRIAAHYAAALAA